jgi:hypothetical protein
VLTCKLLNHTIQDSLGLRTRLIAEILHEKHHTSSNQTARSVLAFVPRSQRKLVSMSLAHHSTLRKAAPAFSSKTTRNLTVLCSSVRQHARSQPAEQQHQQHLQQQSRRALLSQTAAAAAGLMLLRAPTASAAGPLDNIARQLTRPDITPLDVRTCAAVQHCCSS